MIFVSLKIVKIFSEASNLRLKNSLTGLVFAETTFVLASTAGSFAVVLASTAVTVFGFETAALDLLVFFAAGFFADLALDVAILPPFKIYKVIIP